MRNAKLLSVNPWIPYQAIHTHCPLLSKKDGLACFGLFVLLSALDSWPGTPEEAARRAQSDPRTLRRYWDHLQLARGEAAG